LVELAGRIDLNVWNDMDEKARGALTLHVSNIKLHGKSQKQETVAISDSQTATTESKEDVPF